MRFSTAAVCLAGLTLLGAASCPRPYRDAPQLIVLAWDGAGDAVVDRLLADGELPHLARLAAEGVAAGHSLSCVPTKTAAAFATLWTGCWPDRHGVTENWVIRRPNAEHTVLETMRGYSSEALVAEPLYVTAAKAGRKVVVLSATQNYPDRPHVENLREAGVPEDRYLSFSGFEHELAGAKMLDASPLRPAGDGWGDALHGPEAMEMDLRVADSVFRTLVYDDPADPVSGLDTLRIRQRSPAAEAILKPRPAGDDLSFWSPAFAVRRGDREANTFFRLFDLAPDGSRLALYQRRASALAGAHSPRQLAAYLEAYPGFHDTGAYLYRDGELGLPLPVGGDGAAEERMLELMAFDAELLASGTRFVLESWRPDVLFHYSHAVDDAAHAWTGILDPASPSHDPDVAAQIRPYYTRVFRQLDAWLGTVMELAPDAVIALVSDHGMAGVGRRVYLNRALEDAGLVALDASGRIDLGRTRVLAAESPFFLRINDRSFKGGIVAPGDRDAVLEAAAEALRAIRDPGTGRSVVTRIIRPRDFPQWGIDGDRSGDLFFDLAPGYYPENGTSDVLLGPARQPWGSGEHGYWPERRDMHAIFYATGPGLRRGAVVSPTRHIDVAPTLARLAGIPAPPQAEGRVIEAMLEP